MTDEQTSLSNSGGPLGSGDEPGPAGVVSERRSYAELLGLSSLAVALPVLGTFGASPEAFVSARAGWFDIIAFALIVILAPPTALWLLERVAGLVGPVPRRWFHRAAIAGLIAIFVLQLLRGQVGTAAAVLLAGLVAVGATVVVVRFEPARQFLVYLAFAPLLFLVMFLFFSPVSGLLFGSDPIPAEDFANDDLPPIVMIVLDELPLNSLLDGDGNIDADAFPGLADLAENATFARNHTAVSPSTPSAAPAVLTGLLPTDSAALATAQDHPRNLFTLLGGDYEMRSAEYVTEMCPASLCETPDTEGTTREHPLPALLRAALKVPFTNLVAFDVGARGIDPGARFEWLAESFDDSGERPVLNYLHTILPHQDWTRLPDGSQHDGPNPAVGMVGGEIVDDPAAAQFLKQRHMLQLAYADDLVGQTIEELSEADLYDEALIIVTSDHGVSFRPGEPARGLSDTNFADVLWSPLLIKAPHQDEPEVLDSPTAAIDVLPTIVDLLDLDLDWEFDGRSIFGPPRADDWEPRSFGWKLDEIEPSEDGFHYFDGVAGYNEVIASRALDECPDSDLRFWRWGEFCDLVGEDVDSFEQATDEGVTADIDDAGRFESVDLSASTLPTYVSGHISGDRPDAVAVAVNGVVGGWYDTSTGAGDEDRYPFQVMVPPSLLRDGHNEVDVYVIETRGDEVVLIPAETSS